MAFIDAKVNNNSSSSSQLSSMLIQDKGTKRKFRPDLTISDPDKVLTTALNDQLSYEFSAEKFEISTSHEHPPGPCDMCGTCEDYSDTLNLNLGLLTAGMECSCETGSTRVQEEAEVEFDEYQDADWNDFTESKLEELVMNNLDAIFKSAIRKIVVSGYTEEVATNAVLRSGLCYGSKDTVSNVVVNALATLRNGNDIDSSKEHCFQDLKQLEKYVLTELVCVLREFRPFFSKGDAMWCLLICDMNLSHACAMDTEPIHSTMNDGASHVCSSNPPLPLSKPEPSSKEMSRPKPFKPQKSNVKNGKFLDKAVSKSSSNSPLIPLEKPFTAEISQTPTVEEKAVSGKKMHSTNSKREYTLRQKSFHFEKTYKANLMKGNGTFRTAKVSGYILDKRGKPVTDASSINLKGASLKISKAMARGLELAHESRNLDFSSSTSISSDSTTFTIESTTTTTQLPKITHPSIDPIPKPTPKPTVSASLSDTELCLSLPTKNGTRQVNPIVNGGKRDEMIMKLLPRTRELQNQLDEWTEWANQKVMQAAQRLGKDKAELKTLKQEKEEMERLKKEKHSLQENTMKKLKEMENALCKASGQIERANVSLRRLEVENARLKQEMEAAKLQAVKSAISCEEASKREKDTLTNFQSWEKQKCVFQEEISADKRKLSQLQQEFEQTKEVYMQLVARWKQEEKMKDELQTQANSLRKEREQVEASAKSKEDSIKLKAETNLQKYKDDISKLQNEISGLRLQADSSKIAALKKGFDGSFTNKLTNSQTALISKGLRELYKSAKRAQHLLGTGDVKRARECVMCLSEEMSVVFLPCAHQVVCKMCNELHEKQGMNDCPSCRSPILRRISARFARS